MVHRWCRKPGLQRRTPLIWAAALVHKASVTVPKARSRLINHGCSDRRRIGLALGVAVAGDRGDETPDVALQGLGFGRDDAGIFFAIGQDPERARAFEQGP